MAGGVPVSFFCHLYISCLAYVCIICYDVWTIIITKCFCITKFVSGIGLCILPHWVNTFLYTIRNLWFCIFAVYLSVEVIDVAFNHFVRYLMFACFCELNWTDTCATWPASLDFGSKQIAEINYWEN